MSQGETKTGTQWAREVRQLRKALQGLSDAVLVHLHYTDTMIGKDATLPNKVGGKLALLVNELELANDKVRYQNLGVDYRKDDKTKAVKKLLKSGRK